MPAHRIETTQPRSESANECGAGLTVRTVRNNDGETPLHLALQWGHVDITYPLSACGCDSLRQWRVDSITSGVRGSKMSQVQCIRIERGAFLRFAPKRNGGKFNFTAAARQTAGRFWHVGPRGPRPRIQSALTAYPDCCTVPAD